MALNVCRAIIASTLLVSFTACGNDTGSFDAGEVSAIFHQNSSNINAKMDILWVVDNSGSMQSSQDNLADNFSAFIADFVTAGYDYKIAVTTTEAYKSIFTGNTAYEQFKDGTNATGHTGVFVITPQTPDLINTFTTNIRQGTSGSGDERAFMSFKQALNSSLNAGFLRSDAFLSVIIVSDEDDFSHNGSSMNNNYSYSGLHTMQTYIDYLDSITNSTPANRRYNVSAMAIWDQTCLDTLNQSSSGRKIGVRYGQLIDALNNGGIKGDLCGDFATSLEQLAQSIIQAATEFFLNRTPIESTIVVKVNGQVIPKIGGAVTSGWSYNSAHKSIVFTQYAPPQGAQIQVLFDPLYLTE